MALYTFTKEETQELSGHIAAMQGAILALRQHGPALQAMLIEHGANLPLYDSAAVAAIDEVEEQVDRVDTFWQTRQIVVSA